jgi:capsular polysaccharide transport system permease protein
MRELSTRYGRQNLGFLWLIAEPMVFALCVTMMWHALKPEFEHGIRIVPFIVTGYMSLILLRHMIQHGMNCVRVNSSLLYHRHITVTHLFIARLFLEFIGVSFAFLVIFSLFWMIGQMEPPKELALVYLGWVLIAWMAAGLAMIFGALAQSFEFVERVVGVVTYLMVPMSGAFYMADWVPASFRKFLLLLPLVHATEMIRAGFFGEFVTTYYSIPYAIAWAAGLTLLGLAMIRMVRDRLEID